MSTDVSQAIALLMAAARTSETTVEIKLITRQYIPEDSELHNLITFEIRNTQHMVLKTCVSTRL
jgi:hypothetical protein